MKITICGGGNIGLVCASVFVSQGQTVNVLTGHPEAWSKCISTIDCNGNVFRGELGDVSSDPRIVEKSDIVLLCVPGYLIRKTLQDIKPFLGYKTMVGTVVSSTGFFFIAHEVLNDKCKLFGFQRVPFISRVEKYGVQGNLLGYKDCLKVAIENCDDIELFRKQLSEMFMTHVEVLGSYYEAALTNSNPILHTGRLYTMWKDWNGEIYERNTLFYKEWTDEASQMIINMDNEFVKLLDVLPVAKGAIPSLLDYYESYNAMSLTEKISGISAFQSISSPMKEVEGGWVPDFSSRYFTEDFPYGLKYIWKLAHEKGLNVPYIDMVYNWGINRIDNKL